MKNFKTKLFAAAMSAPLAMSGVTAVFAEGATAEQQSSTAPVVKTTINLANDSDPADVSITYTASKADEGNVEGFTYPAEKFTKTITYSAGSANTTWTSTPMDNNMKTLTAETDLFAGINFEHAGVYTWKVTETAATAKSVDPVTATISTNSPDSAAYTVRAYVYNPMTEGSAFDVTYTLEKDGAKLPTAGEKLTMNFSNDYYESMNLENGAFSLTHAVNGELADKKQNFNYSIKYILPANIPADKIAGVLDTDGLTTNDDGTYTASYTAAHGDAAYKLAKAPVGTQVTITAENINGYTTKWNNGGNDVLTFETTISNQGTPVTVVREKLASTSPITGNIINNLPFLGLIAVALGGFIAYIALKRRQNA